MFVPIPHAIRILISAALVTFTAQVPTANAEPQQRIDVCFALDTTGSMSGLIETAKQKIWFIATEIANAPGQPEVRFCLMGYRDRGDEYVTRHVDLTHDLDSIHEALMAFQADGGGDAPEAVNQALLETVDNSSWNLSDDTLRLVFLVGDAPPHTDYDEPQYPEIADRARQLGIIINPVLVGGDSSVDKIWQEIAYRAQGTRVQVRSDGGAQEITTPMDQDLAVLGPRLDQLALPYGPADRTDALRERRERVAELDESVAADRLSFKSATGELVGQLDLIEALDRGELDLNSLNPDWLPPTVRSMTENEMMDHLQTVREQRNEIRTVIDALVTQRRGYVQARRRNEGFDAQVAELIVQQLKGN